MNVSLVQGSGHGPDKGSFCLPVCTFTYMYLIYIRRNVVFTARQSASLSHKAVCDDYPWLFSQKCSFLFQQMLQVLIVASNPETIVRVALFPVLIEPVIYLDLYTLMGNMVCVYPFQNFLSVHGCVEDQWRLFHAHAQVMYSERDIPIPFLKEMP